MLHVMASNYLCFRLGWIRISTGQNSEIHRPVKEKTNGLHSASIRETKTPLTKTSLSVPSRGGGGGGGGG